MSTLTHGSKRQFSYLAVLSLASGRLISADRRSDDELKALTAHLLGIPALPKNVSDEVIGWAREHLFKRYPLLCPRHGQMLPRYLSLNRHLQRGQLRDQDVPFYLLTWAGHTKKDLQLPNYFDFTS